MAQEKAEQARIRYANYLLTHNRAAAAKPVVDALTANPELRERYDVAELRLLLAAAEGQGFYAGVFRTCPRKPKHSAIWATACAGPAIWPKPLRRPLRLL